VEAAKSICFHNTPTNSVFVCGLIRISLLLNHSFVFPNVTTALRFR